MLKPEAFKKQHVAFRHIPYECDDVTGRQQAHGGGVLSRGETVWTTEAFEEGRCPASTTAFVEGIGVVLLDPRWLVRADVLNDSEAASAETQEQHVG